MTVLLSGKQTQLSLNSHWSHSPFLDLMWSRLWILMPIHLQTNEISGLMRASDLHRQSECPGQSGQPSTSSDVVIYNTNLAFLAFLYKIASRGFKKFQQKINLLPVGIEPTIWTVTDVHPTLPICQALPDCQNLIKLALFNLEMNQVQKVKRCMKQNFKPKSS